MNTKTIQLINQLEKTVLKFKGLPFSCCDDNQIDKCAAEIKSKLKCEPDTDHLSFLKTVNGFEWNGLKFYATEKIDKGRFHKLHSFVDQNLMWRSMHSDFSKQLVFGSVDDDAYIKDLKSGKYQIVSSTSGQIFEEFDSFEGLLCEGITKYL